MTWHRIFFSLLLIFLPTQLGYHFWPDWAMVLGRRVDYLAPTIYLTDILIFLTIGAWFVSREVHVVRGNPKSQIPISKQIQRFKAQMFKTKYLWMIALIAFVVANISIAHNAHVAFYKWIKVVEFVLLGWYIVKTKPSFSFVIFPLSIGVFYSSVLAIAQFFLQHSVGEPLWWLGERTFTADTPGIARFDSCQLLAVSCQQFLRPYATFPHPNVLGGFLAVTLPLLIFNLKFSRLNGESPKEATFLKLIAIALGAIALFLTFSRSAIVVGAMAIILMIASRTQHVVSSKGAFVIFGIFSLATFYFLLTTSFTEESVVVRQQLNSAAVKLWQQSPLVGIGLGNFLIELPKALPSRTIYFLQPVHNIYLLILAETGIVGLIFVVWLLWLVVSRKWRMKNGEWRAKSSYFILYSLFSILALGLLDHYPITLQQGQLLFTLFIALNIANQERTIQRQ